MDESWRCTMGSVLPRQRSSENHAGGEGGGRQGLAADDFRDVFGGPPRTVLLRSFYGETAANDGYHHSPAMAGQQLYGGGAFCRRPCGGVGDGRVPTEVGFFDDIFGAGRHVRSRSRSTAKSSSAISSDDFAACRGGGATLSSFASKLRPIAIPSRRYDSSPPSSTASTTRCDYQSTSFTCSTAAYPASRCYFATGGRTTTATNHSSAAGAGDHHRQSHNRGGGFCCFTSNPPTTSNGHSFRRSTTRRGGGRTTAAAIDADEDDTDTEAAWSNADYGYYYSPPAPSSSSAASSSVFGGGRRRRMEEVVMEVRERAPLLMDDGDDVDSVGAAAVDEAIAWAKERFWSQA
uniref:Uncharacterized protein n=1 Tax=Leersia perrieri TaxID=77586 RepID=A0A0D9WT93_9ORYZ